MTKKKIVKKVSKKEAMEMESGLTEALYKEVKESVAMLVKSKVPLDVSKVIQIHVVIDGGKNSKGWVHTHGMYDILGLPDLEIIGITPFFMVENAGLLLNHVAQYMYDGLIGKVKALKVNETMGVSAFCHFRVIQPGPQNLADKDVLASHYSTPRWRLEEIPMTCQACKVEK